MTKTSIAAAATLLVAAGLGPAVAASATAQISAPSAATGPIAGPDFDADGYADLAAGAPYAKADVQIAGSVTVLYGSPSGIGTDRGQEWSQASPGIESDPEFHEFFGSALTAGDFNGDQFDDLAIGVPSDYFVGMVHVLYGGPDGLSTAGSDAFRLGEDGLPSSPAADLGRALTSADFDGDGYDDLGMGAPDQWLDTGGEGAVYVLRGGPNGLGTVDALVLTEDDLGGRTRTDEWFGGALATGDLNGDGHAELVIGSYIERTKHVNGGSVFVVPGSSAGLQPATTTVWSQRTPGVPGKPAELDGFGQTLAVGDLDGNGIDDLVVGGAGDQNHRDPEKSPGAVWALYGSEDGLVAASSQRWNQGEPGILGRAEDGDFSGAAVAVADIDLDGYADLAFSSFLDSFGFDGSRQLHAGNANVLYGSAAGLAAAGNELWSQKVDGVSDSPQKNDYFGQGLTVLDGDGNGYPDLAVGVSMETTSDAKFVGGVHVLSGGDGGLLGDGGAFFIRGKDGVPGRADDSGQLGQALAGRP